MDERRGLPTAARNDPANTLGQGDVPAHRMRGGHDCGAYGDKVAAPDLASAPLGTDDEAAGTTPAAGPPPPGPAGPGETFAGTGDGTGRPAIYAAIAVAIVVAIVAILLIGAN